MAEAETLGGHEASHPASNALENHGRVDGKMLAYVIPALMFAIVIGIVIVEPSVQAWLLSRVSKRDAQSR